MPIGFIEIARKMSNQSKPLSLIFNHKAGFRIQGPEGIYEQLIDIFSAHGYQTKAYEINDSQQFDKIMTEVLEQHLASSEPGIIVAVGGDSTLNTIAKHVLNTLIPVGILLLGAFNYVVRLLSVSLDLLEAA